MVKEFGDAVKAMSKGDISSAPVKTQFGWHVIRLDDIRDLEAPSFEESKDRLKSIMANKAVQNYLTELRNQATIDIRNPEQNPVMPNDATHSAPMAPATDSKPQE
jgi:peptidyl-prolyl cis-trans isomerase C